MSTRAPRRRKWWPYLQRFKDRTGKPRFYVRDTARNKRVAINAPRNTPQFFEAYKKALGQLGLTNVISPDDPLAR